MTDEAIAALRGDDSLGPLVAEYGPMTVEPAENFYERFVVSILRQQVSMVSAAATRERLFDRVEPTPEAMLAADPELLREAGLSRQKTEYVRNVADAFTERGYDREYFGGLSDDGVHDELTTIAGVGPWTADMFLVFALGREDVFPVEDLGVRRGMEQVCGREMTRGEMRERAEAWRPYRSYASRYLWRAYEW